MVTQAVTARASPPVPGYYWCVLHLWLVCQIRMMHQVIYDRVGLSHRFRKKVSIVVLDVVFVTNNRREEQGEKGGIVCCR